MNFFDLRNGIIAGGNLESSGKYELKGGKKTYPTYSAQAINAAFLDVLSDNNPPVTSVLEAYKETFDNLFLPAYKQLLGKNVELIGHVKSPPPISLLFVIVFWSYFSIFPLLNILLCSAVVEGTIKNKEVKGINFNALFKIISSLKKL